MLPRLRLLSLVASIDREKLEVQVLGPASVCQLSRGEHCGLVLVPGHPKVGLKLRTGELREAKVDKNAL